MKRLLVLTAVLLPLCAGMLSAQPKRSERAAALLREDNTRAGNNTNSYEFHPIVETPAPKGFKPVYVSHYGRHGSRSNWGDTSYKAVIDVLSQAKEAGLLTAGGDSLLNEVTRVLEGYDGMDGRLTQRGVREHGLLAERLYDRYPAVFKGDRRVRAMSSTSQRCIISMNAFTVSLGKKNPALQFRLDTGEKFMSYISYTPNYQQLTAGTADIIRQAWEGVQHDTTYVLRRLFTDPVAAHRFFRSADALQWNIMSAAEIAEDFDIEENLYRFVPFDLIYEKWSRSNMSLYLQHCNSVEFGEKRVPLARSLVQDFVDKADEALADGTIAADLRFGHDYPIMTLAAYFGVEGVGDKLSADEIDDNWFGFQNICMASNLQLVFYRNAAGETLVKFFYNEQERLLRGLAPYIGPYYLWDTVKANLQGYLR
ncbi:MAG: hypothetical protein K6F42_02560 [Bacteroidales bacterium]|nr:hypothetical protein [Bacteroidales bacterium]